MINISFIIFSIFGQNKLFLQDINSHEASINDTDNESILKDIIIRPLKTIHEMFIENPNNFSIF